MAHTNSMCDILIYSYIYDNMAFLPYILINTINYQLKLCVCIYIYCFPTCQILVDYVNEASKNPFNTFTLHINAFTFNPIEAVAAVALTMLANL